ncbi:MAG: response regulator [Candidatus Levybacteria bacterium]|nr:response regulator [Candidatus Levybacteria bacterium]
MKKILVAEDDSFLANAYRVWLPKAGFEIKITRDGQEAMDSLSEFAPDLIILDLIMPVKDGFTVLSEIKSNDRWKKIPVIVVSNLGQKEDIDRSMALGAADYIVKSGMPISGMIEKINKFLK